MNNKKLDAGRVWKQLDDDVVPQLKLSAIDRAVYSFLLRHSRLDGKRRMRFAVSWLAHGVRLGAWATRHSLHRLFDHGALRLIECVVSSCPECNSKKAEQPADEFLRWLYRERRLSASDLRVRLGALDDLAAGKLRLVLPAASMSPACKHRPRQVEG